MTQSLDARRCRKDFPILRQQVNGHPLVYLDNAATTQKPQQVIDAISHYYQTDNANVHRGVHTLSERATLAYEHARSNIARFINAPQAKECIFVRGTTEAINLVAQSYVLPLLSAGDEILITHLEHHSNIVPWQLICEQTGAILRVAPINFDGEVLLDEFKALLTEKTAFVAISHISNALGTINPVKEMVAAAHDCGCAVLVDGAQATPHEIVDVVALDCDFYAFSGHKMYGPTGIGVLWAKAHHLEAMRPYQGGGDMIRSVSFTKTEYAPIPYKFEAGTPNIAGAIGLSAAVDYLQTLGIANIAAFEHQLLTYATEALSSVKGVSIIGKAKHKSAVLSFVHQSVHAHDIGTIMNSMGVAIRSGHHCAMPVMDFYGLAATTRASFSFYNTREEVDAFIAAMTTVQEVFT